MKNSVSMCASMVLALAASHAMAQEKLANDSGCLACHDIDKKKVGPGYKQVADKYRGDKNAESRLVKKVLEGSTGVWGDTPMPPNPVSEADAHTLVKWVLSQQ